jgi:hypothetical protein
MAGNAFSTMRKHDFAALGRRLVAKYPAVATELLENTHVPKQTDVSLIDQYFSNTPHLETKKDQLHQNKVFLCAMLHLYQPAVFSLPRDLVGINKGLLKTISRVVNCSAGRTSQIVREVISLYKIYDDFKEQVDAKVKEVEDGSA